MTQIHTCPDCGVSLPHPRIFVHMDPDPPSSPVDVYDVLDPPDWREVEIVVVSGGRL